MLFTVIGIGLSLPALSNAGDTEVKACLKKALAKEDPIYQVGGEADKESGKLSKDLFLICEGEAAKNLYKSINDEVHKGVWPGKPTQGELKYLGETDGASLCYHYTRNSYGERDDSYNCSIHLNISSTYLDKNASDGMTPLKLNK